jgi:hypothetical protein
MKNEDAFTGILAPISLIVLIITCLLTIYAITEMQKPRYTEEITIAGTDYGVMTDPYTIISTDNIEYKTGYPSIYIFATSHIGQRVRLVYVAGNNNECYVTEIHLITNNTVCTVDKCGTPIEVK